jgi:hypothetical protein
MWTCGIDMATQHDSPATVSRTCRARGDRPKEAGGPTAVTVPAAAPGGRARSARVRGSIVTTQMTPTPR